MKNGIKLFLVLITIVVILFAWITNQFSDPKIQMLVIILVALSVLSFLVMNLLEHREQKRRRKAQETPKNLTSARAGSEVKRSGTSFSLKEKKSGLTWGGGNIKASEATRGTKRKFLGK